MGVTIAAVNTSGSDVVLNDLNGIVIPDASTVTLISDTIQNSTLEKIRRSSSESDGDIRTNIASDFYLTYNSSQIPSAVNLTSTSLLDKYISDFNQGAVDEVEAMANKETFEVNYEVGASKIDIDASISAETSTAETEIILPGANTKTWYLKTNVGNNKKTTTFDIEFIKNDLNIPHTPANVVYTENIAAAKSWNSDGITGVSFVGGDTLRIRLTGQPFDVKKLVGTAIFETVQ